MSFPFFFNSNDDSLDRSERESRKLASAKKRMITEDLAGRGIQDERVLAAMQKVPREAFVPLEHRASAYKDHPLEIGWGQTISQPYMVAKMSELLEIEAGEKVLEIGAGSGYQTAILLELGANVCCVEVIPELAEGMERRLRELGYGNFRVSCHDGNWGWPQFLPYDAILLAAAAPGLPPAMEDQLQFGGRMVAPIGEVDGDQVLMRWLRTPDGLAEEEIMPVRFVPLIDPDDLDSDTSE